MRQLGVPTALALAVLCLPAGALGQDTVWNRYTLEDLGGVFIRIEADGACMDAGVAAAAYEADVSIRLIEAEVGVLTREEMLARQGLPELRITLDCAVGPAGAMAYSVGLRVQQAAQMLRDAQITLPEAVTWYTTRIGVSTVAGVSEAVRNTLMETVDEFAKAWAAAHAGEGSP